MPVRPEPLTPAKKPAILLLWGLLKIPIIINQVCADFKEIEKICANKSSMDNRNQSDDRQMIQGDWTCSQCGAKITELPFQPDGDRPLFCRDCHKQKMQSRPRRF